MSRICTSSVPGANPFFCEHYTLLRRGRFQFLSSVLRSRQRPLPDNNGGFRGGLAMHGRQSRCRWVDW